MVAGPVPAAGSESNPRDPPVHHPLPCRLSPDGRTATWNPALTFSQHVLLRIVRPDGTLDERRSLNSGRARVTGAERIESILVEDLLDG